MLSLEDKRETITSLELLEQINFFRWKEGNKTELQHKDLLKIIRDEFEEEIREGKFSLSSYKRETGNGTIREYPMYLLTYEQGKQILTRESRFVRKAVFEYIRSLENRIKEMQQLEYNTKMQILEAKELQSKEIIETITQSFKGILNETLKNLNNLQPENKKIQPVREKGLITIKTKRGLVHKIIRNASGFECELNDYKKLYATFERKYKVNLSNGIKEYTMETGKPISKIAYIEDVLKMTNEYLKLAIELFPEGFKKVKELYKTDFKKFLEIEGK